ncbi:VOC family protein [Marinococcus halophilus]|uniref:VOC family protein n=1 Tax=Marinococcus halophilus TaxID=1371 RepID=A0A510Y9U9_MARHA|nr:VOC family protein [Marinococcus halophilus]OZT80510.1 VOC family protein [Marinococcus halophilus]GEK60150.1 VOC family protein [Marinococcus halophilus]
MAQIQKITPSLWFSYNAEEAAYFYTGIFPESKVKRTAYYGKEGRDIHGMPEGTVLTIEFDLAGQEFVALNGGNQPFTFDESISFIVSCIDQEEVDYYWAHLSAGGDEKAQVCGWLKDKYGVSWQVVPEVLSRYLTDADPAKAANVMKVMLQMKKIDISALQKAYENA